MSTGCGEFENLLAGYEALDESERARVDAHAARCAACGAKLQALADLGRALVEAYGDVFAPPTLLSGLGGRLCPAPPPKPSAAAAILDLAAWSAVAGAGVAVARYFAPPVVVFNETMLYATAGALALGGLAATLWSFRESED